MAQNLNLRKQSSQNDIDEYSYEQDFQIDDDISSDHQSIQKQLNKDKIAKQDSQSQDYYENEDDFIQDDNDDDFESFQSKPKQNLKTDLQLNKPQSIQNNVQKSKSKSSQYSSNSKNEDAYDQESFQPEELEDEDYNEVIDNKISQALQNQSNSSQKKSAQKGFWDDKEKSNNNLSLDRSRTDHYSQSSIINKGEIKPTINIFKTEESLVNIEDKKAIVDTQAISKSTVLKEEKKITTIKGIQSSNRKEQENIKPSTSQQNRVSQQAQNQSQSALKQTKQDAIKEPQFKVSNPQTAIKNKRLSVQRQITMSQQKNQEPTQSIPNYPGSKPKKFINLNEVNRSFSRPLTSKVQTLTNTQNSNQTPQFALKSSQNRNTQHPRTFTSMIQQNQSKIPLRGGVNLNQTSQQALKPPASISRSMIGSSQGVGVRERLKQIIHSKRNISNTSQNRMSSQTRSTTFLGQSDTKRSVATRGGVKIDNYNNEGSARYGNKESTRFGSSKRLSTDSFIHQSNIQFTNFLQRPRIFDHHKILFKIKCLIIKTLQQFNITVFQVMIKSNMSVTKSRMSLGRYQPQNQSKLKMNNSMGFTNRLQSAGMISSRSTAAQQSQVMIQSTNNLQSNVKQIKIADYYNKDPRDSLVLSQNGLKQSQSSVAPIDRMLRMSQESEFPIKILDNIIQVEEQLYGFSLYNRGNELKKSLIDPQRVKAYIEQHQQQQSPNKPKNQVAIRKEKQEKDDWQQTLNFFKENPQALLEAIPTPRNDNNELNDFQSGLTPKKAFDFKFDNNSTLGFQNRGNSTKNLMILQQGTPNHKNRLVSPKANPLLSSRKLGQSQSKTGLRMLNTSGLGQALSQSSSRQFLQKSPSMNKQNQSFNRSFSKENLQKIYGGNTLVSQLQMQSPLKKNNFEKKDFRISQTLRNVQSAKSQQRVFNGTQQSFNQQRQSVQADDKLQSYQQLTQDKPVQERKTKRLQLIEEQEKALNNRKLQANKIKQKIKTDYFDGPPQKDQSSSRALNTGKNSQKQLSETNQNFMNRALLSTLDWKTSKTYQEYVVARKNNKLVFDQNDGRVFREDEIDYVLNIIIANVIQT